MKQLKKIEMFPSQLQLHNTDDTLMVLDYDGQQGMFTRLDWIDEDPILANYNLKDQNEILNSLESTYNESFFAKN